MSDLNTTLARLAGTRDGLVAAKSEFDAALARVASAQVSNASEIAAVVAQLQGVAGYRAVTSVDDACNAERTAGQTAVVQAVKADPTITEDAAKGAWRSAALASRPADRQWLLCDPDGLLQEYQSNLGLAGWEAFRAWIVATPVDQMGI